MEKVFVTEERLFKNSMKKQSLKSKDSKKKSKSFLSLARAYVKKYHAKEFAEVVEGKDYFATIKYTDYLWKRNKTPEQEVAIEEIFKRYYRDGHVLVKVKPSPMKRVVYPIHVNLVNEEELKKSCRRFNELEIFGKKDWQIECPDAEIGAKSILVSQSNRALWLDVDIANLISRSRKFNPKEDPPEFDFCIQPKPIYLS